MLRKMFLVLFVMVIVNVIEGADISIQSFGCISGNNCRCNENITIMCTITPYQQVLYWKADGQTLAICSISACVDLGNEYHFDFDRTGGRSNLTFLPLRLDHQGIVFQCDEAGTDNAQFIPTVDVSVDENDFNIEQTNTIDGNFESSIHSIDCVSSPDTISFEWVVSESRDLNTEAFNFETTFERTQNKTIVACTNSENSNCGGNATSKISSSIQIPNSTGSSHYVFVKVRQNGNDVTSFRLGGMINIANNDSNITTQNVSTDTQPTSSTPMTNSTMIPSTKDTTPETNTDITVKDNSENAMQTPFILLTVGGIILLIFISSSVINIVCIYVKKEKRKEHPETPSFTNITDTGLQSTNMECV